MKTELKPFGRLKAFNLVMDKNTGKSKVTLAVIIKPGPVRKSLYKQTFLLRTLASVSLDIAVAAECHYSFCCCFGSDCRV